MAPGLIIPGMTGTLGLPTAGAAAAPPATSPVAALALPVAEASLAKCAAHSSADTAVPLGALAFSASAAALGIALASTPEAAGAAGGWAFPKVSPTPGACADAPPETPPALVPPGATPTAPPSTGRYEGGGGAPGGKDAGGGSGGRVATGAGTTGTASVGAFAGPPAATWPLAGAAPAAIAAGMVAGTPLGCSGSEGPATPVDDDDPPAVT